MLVKRLVHGAALDIPLRAPCGIRQRAGQVWYFQVGSETIMIVTLHHALVEDPAGTKSALAAAPPSQAVLPYWVSRLRYA